MTHLIHSELNFIGLTLDGARLIDKIYILYYFRMMGTDKFLDIPRVIKHTYVILPIQPDF